MTSHILEELAGSAIPRVAPPLDPAFRPAALANRIFRTELGTSGIQVNIALERPDGTTSVYETSVFPPDNPKSHLNLPYIERIVKFLLWQKGGCRITLVGCPEVADAIQSSYSPKGARSFDYSLIGETVYEKPLEIEIAETTPPAREVSMPLGRHLDGYRIGFDLGASDRKVAAVVDGESIFSEETPWDPRNQSDIQYHYDGIMASLCRAASHMPRVDAIGGSSAGVIIANRPMVASLFRGIPKEVFEARGKSLFLDIARVWGVPFEVANDGDVSALAGAMSLDVVRLLGIAMGSSEAAGYVNAEGNITGWLNELAFAPIDYSPNAPPDEWSGDIGCGAQYLSQQAVFRLAETVGIPLDSRASAAGKLESVQELLEAGDERAQAIWETIGCYTGYAIAHYADFYDLEHVLLLGRVTSGSGGAIILSKTREVLSLEFPEIAVDIHLPDEKSRRIGQAVAAASLPAIPHYLDGER